MKILITGGTGLLGKALTDTAGSRFEILATYLGDYTPRDAKNIKYRKLDITDSEGYRALFMEFEPDVVIHTAGVGSPDHAEKYKREARRINIGGIRNMIANCEEHGSKFIYISSNGIYDGRNAPYSEDSDAKPINYYGKIKLDGEKLTRKARVPYAIVRPILMYGWNHSFERNNIISFALSKLKEGEKVYAYDDVYVNPLYAGACAEAIWKIVRKDKYDVFNISGNERMSIYRFVQKAAEIFGHDINMVLPVQQGFFNELVRRPRDTHYVAEKMHKVLGVKPLTVEEGLHRMKKDKKA